jgi:N-acetylmuramoyl-L-alanine amidase
MLKSPSHQRGLWVGLVVLAVFGALTPAAAHSRTRHSDSWAREHFSTAERMREALNGRPPADRTRRDYQRVLNAYRYVYLGAPASPKADPSVVAVAETLVEMGRRFDDDKILHEAIEQYKFLRREYPGSKYRFDALFTVGEIYKDDLNDPEAARSAFQEFLRRYPHNRLVDDARQAIVELNQEAEAEKAAEAQKIAGKKQSGKSGNNKEAADAAGENRASHVEAGKDSPEQRSGHLPRVTGIRHWSTPDYTRVAIDVESDVKFSSQRIDSPARIFFDLRDTKLASTLVGKSFDVDDGFLKKVRVAQFAPGRTRVVLEVDNLSDYDAFLLPNPYRLIIDVHGKNGRAKQLKDKNGDRDKDASETAAALTDGMASPKPIPDDDTDANASDLKPAVSAHAAVAHAGKIPVAGANISDAARAASGMTAVGRNSQTPVVVKKIVEADGDDDEDTSAASREATKQRAQGGKSGALPTKNAVAGAKKPVDNDSAGNDLDSDADPSDSSVLPLQSPAATNNVGDSRDKSGSRSLASGKPGSVSAASDLGIREARPTASGDRSLIRALGLKIGKIVIDPGHGGHDTGTIGPNGLEEKDLVLDVGRRLGKLLETRLGAEVVYTRRDDTFIPLETRTAVANQARADLFVSIHANSSHDPDARGVETYYLNFTSSPEALEVAARENAVSAKSIYELQDLVKKIALKEKIEESREFAGDVQESLHSGLAVKSPAIRDRGVKKAPFIVLIGANMPSILAEISFVSNPSDEHRLATGEYRQRIAESLYRGIAKYVNGLSGVKVASKMDKAAGQ